MAKEGKERGFAHSLNGTRKLRKCWEFHLNGFFFFFFLLGSFSCCAAAAASSLAYYTVWVSPLRPPSASFLFQYTTSIASSLGEVNGAATQVHELRIKQQYNNDHQTPSTHIVLRVLLQSLCIACPSGSAQYYVHSGANNSEINYPLE